MICVTKSNMSISSKTVAKTFELLENKKVFFHNVTYNSDRTVTISDEHYDNLKMFGSCSYMGLSYYKPAIDALKKGADETGLDLRVPGFSLRTSKAHELELLLGQIFGGQVFLGSSTSVASQSFLYSCVDQNDVIVIEKGRTHGSILQASSLPHCPVYYTDTSKDFTKTLNLLQSSAKTAKTVWYVSDSIDSSTGSYFSPETYHKILECDPKVKMFIDDAHGVFTTGKHGCGVFLRDTPLTERIVVAGSLNKAFAGDGGFVVFGDPELYKRMRLSAMPQYFSGNIKPPFIYADIELAKFFLSPEYEEKRSMLEEYGKYMHNELAKAGIKSTASPEVPLKTIHIGYLNDVINITNEMKKQGYWIFPMPYPGVPRGHSAVRFCANASHTWQEVRDFVKVFIQVIHKCCPNGIPDINTRVNDPAYNDVDSS